MIIANDKKSGKRKAKSGNAKRFCAVVLFLFAAQILFADDAQKKIFSDRAQNKFLLAQKQFQSDTNNFTNAWQFGRACFDWADFATNKTQRAAIARKGIAVCQQALARDTNSAAAHYYLALNFGQLAQTESFGALKLVHEMEGEFKITANLDAHFDFAGPARGLGLLYRDAPGWPLSIGNKRKAREFLESAAKLAPDDPENILNLAETFLKWNDRANAKKELAALDSLWPKAQKNFTGDFWQQSWDDWTTRRDALRKRLKT